MAIPAGITTATITFGVPVSFTGGAVRSTVSIVPSASLVHTATGTPLVNFIEDVITSEGVSGQFVLPHTDQTGFQDESGNSYQNWYYTATISYSAGKVTLPPRTKTFQLPTGQTVIDLDLLPAGAPVLPYTAQTAVVTSFAGRTGAVTVQDADLPTRLSDASLNATFVPKWKATTAYLAGDKVLSPTGDVVSAKVDFTSGASYDAANWDLSATFAPATVNGKAPVRKDDLVYHVADYGLKADNGVTDNAPLFSSMLGTIPDGSIVKFGTNGTNHYGFGSTTTINKAITITGNWGRTSSGAGPVGSVLRPLANSTFTAANPMFLITTGRVKISGLAIIGRSSTDTAATTNGTTTVQLSGGLAAATWMVGCAVSGTDVPSLKDAVTTVTAVNTGTNQITLSAAATGSTTGTATIKLWNGQGIKFGSGSHQSKMFDMLITSFSVGANMGQLSDHITAHASEISGSYDNLLFDVGNYFDYAFYDCNLTGAAHASARLAGPNTSTQNVLFSRTHLGFSPYGLTQDATTDGSGWAGVTFTGSPIEYISQQHISIVNGGSFYVDGATYWGWTEAPAAKVAFQVSNLIDVGPIDLRMQLLANTPNASSPGVFKVDGNQNGFPVSFGNIALNGFAQALRANGSGLTEQTIGGASFLNGSTTIGNQATFTALGPAAFSGAIRTHYVTKTGTYTSGAADAWIRCTSGTWTLTLSPQGSQQILFVTNEGAGTITMAVVTGAYFGPATLAPGTAATYISDGTNWRCVSGYGIG